MEETTNLILIECSQELANELRAKMEALPDTQYQVSERKNLDGSGGTWIVIATLAIQALPSILTFLSSRRPELPSKIEVTIGDVKYVIENPSHEDVELLRKKYLDPPSVSRKPRRSPQGATVQPNKKVSKRQGTKKKHG